MSVSDLNAVFYSKTYHPIQAGSIDGTDTLCHDNAVYRALIATTTGLYDGMGDSKAEGDPYCTVFVGRLSRDTKEETLKEAMSNYGRVKNLRLVRHIVTGASQGYGFVEYETEKEMRHAYEAAQHINIDGCQVLVDYNRQLLMPGWIPRRLGGGLGGCKESGQLRFGGRDRPFRKPLRPIPREELEKLGIPLPPEGHYLSRFEVPPLPKRRSNISMTRLSKHQGTKMSEENSRQPLELEEKVFLKEESSSHEKAVRRRHHHRHERKKGHGTLVSVEKSHKPSELEGKIILKEQLGSEDDETRQYHYRRERRKDHGKSRAHPGHEENVPLKEAGSSHEEDGRRQHHRRHEMREDHRYANDDLRKESLIEEGRSSEKLDDWKQHKRRGSSKAARTPSENESSHTGDRTQPKIPQEVRREKQTRKDEDDVESRINHRNVNDDVRKYSILEEGGSSETDDRILQKNKQWREAQRSDDDDDNGERKKDYVNVNDDVRKHSTLEEHRNVEEMHDRRLYKGRGSYKAERTSENVSSGMHKMSNQEEKQEQRRIDVGDGKRKYALFEKERSLEEEHKRTQHKSRKYSKAEGTPEENGSPEIDDRRQKISKQESSREGGIDDYDDNDDRGKRTFRKHHREEHHGKRQHDHYNP